MTTAAERGPPKHVSKTCVLGLPWSPVAFLPPLGHMLEKTYRSCGPPAHEWRGKSHAGETLTEIFAFPWLAYDLGQLRVDHRSKPCIQLAR